MIRTLILTALISLTACQKVPGTIGAETQKTLNSPHERPPAACRQAADLNNPEAKSIECPAPDATDPH
jgi:starvation-inducible outer membrane lipoprotein